MFKKLQVFFNKFLFKNYFFLVGYFMTVAVDKGARGSVVG
jgi:hypothetical protein